VIARAAGLKPGEIPLPLSAHQAYTLDERDGAQQVLRPLGVELPDSEAEAFAVRMRELGRKPAPSASVL
jgi:hypothetical protein